MATPFEEFVNRELPRRPAMLTYAVTGYDGDPNAGGVPAIVSGAPAGSFFLRQTGTILYWKKTSAAGSYEEVGGGGGGSIQREFTEGNITVSVDPSNPTAADPPPGTVFISQAEVDAWLAAQGTTVFQHAEAYYNTLPSFVIHTITINLAAGVHRPWTSSPITSTAFCFSTRYVFGTIDIIGAAPSTWTPMYGLTGLTVTGYQSANRDPYLNFAGTPFVGLDLRGYFVVLSTGQTCLIHDHTNSRLNVTSVISPTPVGATCFVGRPSTLLRNSLDDVATYKSGTVQVGTGILTSGISGFTLRGFAYLRNVTLDPFGNSSNAVVLGALSTRFEYVLLDQETCRNPPYNKIPNGNCFNCSPSDVGNTTLYLCSVIEKNPGASGVDVLFLVSAGSVAFYGCYFEGGEDGSQVTGRNISFYSTVFNRACNLTTTAVLAVIESRSVDLYDVGTAGSLGMGKAVEFRNGRAGIPCLKLYGPAARLRAGYSYARFVSNAGPLIQVESGAEADFTGTAAQGPQDGGGNTNYGVVFNGAGSSVRLPLNATATAALGAVKMKDGTVIATLADVKALGPIVDGTFNYVEKL